jgi:hypothetical protein
MKNLYPYIFDYVIKDILYFRSIAVLVEWDQKQWEKKASKKLSNASFIMFYIDYRVRLFCVRIISLKSFHTEKLQRFDFNPAIRLGVRMKVWMRLGLQYVTLIHTPPLFPTNSMRTKYSLKIWFFKGFSHFCCHRRTLRQNRDIFGTSVEIMSSDISTKSFVSDETLQNSNACISE